MLGDVVTPSGPDLRPRTGDRIGVKVMYHRNEDGVFQVRYVLSFVGLRSIFRATDYPFLDFV